MIMNKNIDLTKILKNCPEGTEFWSDNVGKVQFLHVNECFDQPILVRRADGFIISYTKEGWENIIFPGSCLLWPSKDYRDWTKFTAPWYKPEESTISPSEEQRDCNKVVSLWRKHEKKETVKKKEKFNPQTLHEFDKVLVRDGVGYKWNADFYSYKLVGRGHRCVDDIYDYCIPYNDDTKHLIGTNDEAPEYYRYWEDEIWIK